MNAADVITQAREVLAHPIPGDHESESARSALTDLIALAEEQTASIAQLQDHNRQMRIELQANGWTCP